MRTAARVTFLAIRAFQVLAFIQSPSQTFTPQPNAIAPRHQ